MPPKSRQPDPQPEETPPPAEEPRLSSPMPSWKAPRQGDPWDAMATPPSSDPSPATGWDGSDEAGVGLPGLSDEPPETGSPRTGPSRTSSRGGLGKKKIRETLERAIEGVTAFAHQRLTDEAGEAAGLYLADEDDVRDIAAPGAELIHRRTGTLPLTDEVADGFALAIAVGTYLAKQLNAWGLARRMRAQEYDTGVSPFDGLEEDQGPEPAPDLEGAEAASDPAPATVQPAQVGRPPLPGLSDLAGRL